MRLYGRFDNFVTVSSGRDFTTTESEIIEIRGELCSLHHELEGAIESDSHWVPLIQQRIFKLRRKLKGKLRKLERQSDLINRQKVA